MTAIATRPNVKLRAVEDQIRSIVHDIDPSVRVEFERSPGQARRRRYTWDGSTLVSAGSTYESYLHDVAHWLVATKQQRAEPEFGLGPDPYRDSDAALIVTTPRIIEEHVCDVQMVLVLVCGLDATEVVAEVGAVVPQASELQDLQKRFPDILSSAMWVRAALRLEQVRFDLKKRHLRERIGELQRYANRAAVELGFLADQIAELRKELDE